MATPASAAPPFQNVYYKRQVATAKACFVCYRPTTTVLATLNATDFIYTCDSHLADTGFATRIVVADTTQQPPSAPKASPEEIQKVKEEWDARQKAKAERAKEQAKEKGKEAGEGKDKDKEKSSSWFSLPSIPFFGQDASDAPKPDSSTQSTIPVQSTPAPSGPAKHERYALHRDIFGMRQGEHRKRRNMAQAKAIAPRLPGAPRGGLE